MIKIGTREFDTDKRTYVMGILNVTPDSFSDGGQFTEVDRALYHAEQMIQEGADLLDIGGESSRPGYAMITDEEEIGRIAPVIENIKSRFEIPLSLDTCKSRVAKAGIQAGADLINDIWGLKYDTELAPVLSQSQIPCCLMHNRPMENREEAVYTNLWEELRSDLEESVQLAVQAGLSRDLIILDPGIGFAKTDRHNLEILRTLEVMQTMGFPVLLGTSRKSVIGATLDLPVTERLEGTIVTSVVAVEKGCSFIRVHDVKANVRAVRMAEAIFYA